MGFFDRITERVGGIFGDFIEEVMIPDEIHQRIVQATTYYDRGEYETALGIIASLQRIQPNLARVHYLEGLCHFHRGAPQEAARAFRRALELKEQPHSHLWAGLSMEQMREWRSAQDHFRRALALTPTEELSFDLYFGLGRVYLAQSRADKAVKELRKALRISDNQPEASVALAQALFERGRLDEARAAIEHAGPSNFEGVKSHLIYARLLHAMEELPEALGAYHDAAMASTGQPVDRLAAQLGCVRVALELGELELAAETLDAAKSGARGEPRADLHVLQARLATANGEDPVAARHYELALQQDPSHGEALRGVGYMSLAAGQPQIALEHFKRALETSHHRDPEESLLGQGLARHAMNDLSGARQVLDEATKARRDRLGREHEPDARVLHALGKVALTAGDYAEAIVALRDAADHARDPALARSIDDDMTRALDELKPGWALPATLDNPLHIERTLQALQDYIAADSRLVDFMPPTQQILRALNAPLSIAIVGEFNAGKSTLINALIGEDIVPMGVLPTTAHTGIIQYGPRQAARVMYRGDQDAVEVSFPEAKKLMKTNADEIDYLEYLYPHPELRAVHFWDTPGFNALEERHEEVAARALEQAEAILWVLDANQVLSQTEFDRIENIPGGDQRLLVVINKIDRLGGPGERDEAVAHLLDYVEQNAGAHVAGCYPISALRARQELAEAGELDAEADTTGFVSFRQHLHERITERAGMIKTMETKRHLGGLILELTTFQHSLIQGYRGLGEQVTSAGGWLEEVWETRPRRVAEFELMEYEDRIDQMLRAVSREIAEALKPRNTLVSQRMVLSEEDREFLLGLLKDRFAAILERSRERVINDVLGLEAELAERMGPVLSGLSLQDARGLNRRLEGFQDEVRVLKLLLEERVYGQIEARATGQIDAAGELLLSEIEQLSDQNRWRGLLRKVIPQPRESFVDELAQWYDKFFVTARRFCDRAKRDLSLLELEAHYRYDVTPVEALLTAPPQGDGGEG